MTSFVRNLGTDVEVFGTKNLKDDIVTPAFFVLGGDIDLPLRPGTSAYCDGAAVEFTVDPSPSPDEMANRIFENLGMVTSHMKSQGYRLSLSSFADVGLDNIKQLPIEVGKRPSLQILGCDADYRIYDDADTMIRPDPKVYPYRSLGGHIHFELDEAIRNDPLLMQCVGFALDICVGLYTTANVPSINSDEQKRRKLYGLSGTYRKPKYGFEYRVPSARGILLNKSHCRKVFAIARNAVDTMLTRVEQYGIMDAVKPLLDFQANVRYAIDTAHSTLAGQLLYQIPFAREVERSV